MASTKDIHDIMGMGGAPVQKPANKKKKKLVEAQPRLTGISREVQALMGDSVPPVQIVEAPKYKSKPSLAAKLYRPRHWAERPFAPGARSDGLSLNHWKRATTLQRPQQTIGDTDMTGGGEGKEVLKSEYQFEEEFPMEKWDVRIRVPQYTDEQYEKHYNTDDWSREETDYLMRLVSDYDLRWILISDRYNPADIKAPASEVTRSYPSRTTEQLKLRYYQIAAQDLELKTPKSNMNPNEFQLWEKMRNFDAKTEGLRKAMAEKLLERTKEEAEEERTLLEELHRITKNEEEFINMRRDLYARLEAAPSLRRNERGEEQNIVLSSVGLSDLLSRLFAKEKHLKRRAIPNGEANTGAATAQTPVDGRARQSTAQRRDTIESTSTDIQKKGSVSAPVLKQLTKAEEEKYGVTHPTERLTSGVSFRHEKINRVTTAKSQVQTQKINAALTELGIPARLSMPTEKVCKEFERLVGQISLLLDARKTLTRVSEEVKTLEEMRRQRVGEPAPAQEGANGDAIDAEKQDSVGDQQGQLAQPDRANGTRGVSTQAQHPEEAEPADGGPGPAVDEDDDAEAEDDVEAANVEQTQVEDDEDQDDTNVNDDSTAQINGAIDDDDDDQAQNEDDDEGEADEDEEQEEEDEDDDDDDEGMAALRRGVENDDEDEEEQDDEDEDAASEPEEDEAEDNEESMARPGGADTDNDDEDDEQEDDNTKDVTMNEVESAEGDPDVDARDNDVPESRPVSGHKRGASVVSDASGTRSNRSGDGRKRKR